MIFAPLFWDQSSFPEIIVGNEVIQEICTAKKYYENKFNEQFNLIAITNNDFSSSAKILAKSNDIQLIQRTQFEDIITTKEITIQEITKMEAQRLARI